MRKRDPREGIYVTKLTDEVTAKVVAGIRGGATFETAALYAGIERKTLRRWCKIGRAGLDADDTSEELRPYVEFVRALDEALASFKLALTTGIFAAAQGRDGQPGQWQAYAWLGERRFPDEFGRRTRVEHANADGTPFALTASPQIDPTKLTDEELEQLEEILRKARPAGEPPVPLPPKALLDETTGA